MTSDERISHQRKKQILLEMSGSLHEGSYSDNPAVCAGYRGTNANVLVPWQKGPLFVVKPRSVEEVQETIRIANKYRLNVMPIGCGTITAYWEPDILVDMTGMKKILKIDTRNGYVVVEPGVTFSQILPTLAKEGFTIAYGTIPLSFTVLSHLGALRTFNHNFSARVADQTLGFEIVLPDGTVLRTGTATYGIDHWSRMTGDLPDIQGLFIPARQGSPSFGIITKAAIRIWPRMEARGLPISAFDSFSKGMEYALKVAQAGIADQSMVWSWCLVSFVNERFGTAEDEFRWLNYMLDSSTDYSKPFKGMAYCYNWTQIRGYKEQVDANLNVCRRIAKEVGGRVLEEPEIQSTIPNIWQDWKGNYYDLDCHSNDISERSKAGNHLFPSGVFDAWFNLGPIDEMVRLEKGYNQRLKEKHKVRVLPYYARVLEYGTSSHLRYTAFVDMADEIEVKRYTDIKVDMAKWVLQNYPNAHVHSPFRPIQTHSMGMGHLIDKIREALDPNHIMYVPGEKRLEPEQAEEGTAETVTLRKGGSE